MNYLKTMHHKVLCIISRMITTPMKHSMHSNRKEWNRYNEMSKITKTAMKSEDDFGRDLATIMKEANKFLITAQEAMDELADTLNEMQHYDVPK